ncbi:MAG: hypothetical protein NVSMB31_17440 [Vulcanimicrobiaceae bacterium]
MMKFVRFAAFLMIFCSAPLAARCEYAWQRLSPVPTLPKSFQSGLAPVNGIHLWYATFGKGKPVILIHGGLANANYWGLQVRALATKYKVIVLDAAAKDAARGTTSR